MYLSLLSIYSFPPHTYITSPHDISLYLSHLSTYSSHIFVPPDHVRASSIHLSIHLATQPTFFLHLFIHPLTSAIHSHLLIHLSNNPPTIFLYPTFLNTYFCIFNVNWLLGWSIHIKNQSCSIATCTLFSWFDIGQNFSSLERHNNFASPCQCNNFPGLQKVTVNWNTFQRKNYLMERENHLWMEFRNHFTYS